MVYVSNGQVLQERSSWSPSTIVDYILEFFCVIYIFFRTLINPGSYGPKSVHNSSGKGPGGGGPGGPGRRFGGIRRAGGAPPPPPMSGGG